MRMHLEASHLRGARQENDFTFERAGRPNGACNFFRR